MKRENNHIVITSHADCCGCTACASICSQKAIKMRPDAFGFAYPQVDEELCVECGACVKVCAFNDRYDISQNFSKPIVYGARHKNQGEVLKSRSGAAFVAISDYVLAHEGVVYGAGYKDHFRVAHKRAENQEERDEFRGSKYVQSDLEGIFAAIKRDLQGGLLVLFSGTPCQTAGLNAYVGKKYRSNLILVDIVCHGVPGPHIWRDYMQYIEKKEGASIKRVNFRDKEAFGWADHKESFVLIDKKGEERKVSYSMSFYNDILIRHSCNQCPFANTRRPSDITLGDFWGYERINPNINTDNRGVNLILINTEKGLDIFRKVDDKLDTIEVKTDDYLQPNLVSPTEKNPLRDAFEEYYKKNGFEKAVRQFKILNIQEQDNGVRILFRRMWKKLKRGVKWVVGIK